MKQIRPRTVTVTFELHKCDWPVAEIKEEIKAIFGEGGPDGMSAKQIQTNVIDATKPKKKTRR